MSIDDVLQIGTNDTHEVVVNLPRDMTGHIIFSPDQARSLADTLLKKAAEADRARRDVEEAARIAAVPPADRSKLCTTSGAPVADVRANQKNETGQHDGYIVLCPEERAKGFVRPYRDRYEHVGRSICGKLIASAGENILGGSRFICDEPHGHEGQCVGSHRVVSQPEHADIERTHRIGGCNGVTTMGRALSETYARDPSFYGATFCCGCNRHMPIAEFIWTADGQQVGS